MKNRLRTYFIRSDEKSNRSVFDWNGSIITSEGITNENADTHDLLIASRDITISQNLKGYISFENRLVGLVVQIKASSFASKLKILVQGSFLIAEATNNVVEEMNITVGQEVELLFHAHHVIQNEQYPKSKFSQNPLLKNYS